MVHSKLFTTIDKTLITIIRLWLVRKPQEKHEQQLRNWGESSCRKECAKSSRAYFSGTAKGFPKEVRTKLSMEVREEIR